MKSIRDSFAAGALPYWNRFLVGRAWLEDRTAGSLRFLLGPAASDSLSDVELNDHRLFAPGRWPWRPPLRMTVRARASHSAAEFAGTAGFGFWNAPFSESNSALAAPQAVWFFHASPPSFLSMVAGGLGSGWRAQVINAPQVPKWIVLAGGAAWYVLKPLRPLFYRAAAAQVGGGEALVPGAFDAWHTYRLDWLKDRVDFFVDGSVIYTTKSSPRGPLGFVAWIDNSMLNIRGDAFAFGNVAVTKEQWMELSEVLIDAL